MESPNEEQVAEQPGAAEATVAGEDPTAKPAPEVEINVDELLDDKYVDTVIPDEEQQKEEVKPSPTALMLDQWMIRHGKEMHDESEIIRQSLPNELGDDAKVLAATDLFALAWEPQPMLAAVCEDQQRSNYIRSLMETTEFQKVKTQTVYNDLASEIAAASFAKGLEVVASTKPTGEKVRDEAKVLKLVKDAAREASEEVSQASGLCNALGVTMAQAKTTGNRDQVLSRGEIGLLFSKIRGNYQLQNIMRLAGRYRRLAQSHQRTKPCVGRDEITGIEQTGDVERLLPAELAGLTVPELEDDLLRRIVERSCMGYRFEGREGEARGPIVVLVDESGSMSGDKIAHAKAICLAMAWIARHQKRYCCLGSFSDSSTPGVWLPMPGGECPPADLLNWLGGFIGGGTDLTVMTEELPANWDNLGCPDGKTDIICITDACLHCEDERATAFNEWRRSKNARVETIVVGFEGGQMQKISDKVHAVNKLGVEVEAVGDLMDV